MTGGLINATYKVMGPNGPVAALQRLHPVFAAEVNLDIEAITTVLAEHGMVTPQLLRTTNGAPWALHEGHVWRSISWVRGQCFSELPRPSVAKAAAELVAQFHRALDGFDYEFQFTRAGVHDTKAHFAKLHSAEATNFPELGDANDLRNRIQMQAALLPPLPPLPTRICHGDLKISNLLFDSEEKGLCLIDLDTMAYQNIAYELGDALRSWANLAGEDQEAPPIDLAVIEHAAIGYARGSQGLLSVAEIASVIVGLETICLELAARFCIDVYDDSYFGWDSERYGTRREHNLIRGHGQLALCQSVATQRDALEAVWAQAF